MRRVKDARYPDALLPLWRYHPFVTNSDLSTTEADLTHRRHAIIETTFADLIDGPLARIPSGCLPPTAPGRACAVIAHKLLRAAGVIAGAEHALARGATLRRRLVTVPARFAAPARKPMLHLPAHWPWQVAWKTLWDSVISHRYPTAQPPPNPAPPEPTGPSPPRRPGPTRGTRNKEKLVQASRSPMHQHIPNQPRLSQTRRAPLKITDPRIPA
jgi:hypothetical protein